jgi:2-amino-4-hydroxy-6-hydroxymethyldihydropteridine diphosphokinase|tara:strand:+ start:476 stop:853 length:378 start_codon:yes stop_codon:yes gene_type:complete
MKYFLSLGSNIDAKINLDFAQNELKKILTNIRLSSIHTTKAEGFDGDDFLNLVISGESDDSFEEINNKLKSIEDDAGRDRDAPKFSSRTLDIDIILQIDKNEEIVFESDEIQKYNFVSDPLKELI